MLFGKIFAYFWILITLLSLANFTDTEMSANKPSSAATKNNFFTNVNFVDVASGREVSAVDFLSKISRGNVVYILEEHDNVFHRRLGAEIGKIINSGNKNFAVGFEIFNKNNDDQKYLDLYREKKISEEEFKRIAWKWEVFGEKDSYALYKDVLDLIGISGLKGVALNIPVSLVKQLSGKIIATEFENLSDEEKSLFYKDGFKDFCDNAKYHNAIMRGLEEMRRQGGIVTTELEKRFHTIQWIMNEAMATGILNYFENQSLEELKMMVVVGLLHGIYNEGILASAKSRNPNIKQITILAIPSWIDRQTLINDKAADFILTYNQ